NGDNSRAAVSAAVSMAGSPRLAGEGATIALRPATPLRRNHPNERPPPLGNFTHAAPASACAALQEPMPKRVCRRRGTRRHVDLREDVADVPIHGLLAERELGRGLPVRAPRRDEPQHFELPPREIARGAGNVRLHAYRLHVRELRPRLEALDGRARGLELERGAVLVAERAAGAGDRHACPRSGIRRAELLPQAERAAQRRERRVRVALDELYLAAHVRRP